MKRVVASAFVIVCQLFAALPVNSQLSFKELEEQVWQEHNNIRRHPEAYIPLLETWLDNTDAQGNVRLNATTQLQTVEGRQAIVEAIAFLKQQARQPKLSQSRKLQHAARAHAQYLQPGLTGHYGRNGQSPTDRFLAYGRPEGRFGENISYGFHTPEMIVMGLVINDGNPRRGHRNNVFNASYQQLGVGCDSHQRYRVVCVMKYATRFR